MRFINKPNIPEGAVKLIVIDGRVEKEIEATIKALGVKTIKTCRHSGLYEAVSFHPDLQIHQLDANTIVYAPDTDENFLNEISKYGFSLIKGDICLTTNYPGNIAYNVARVGDLAFHNIKYTDKVLKIELEKRNIELVHVNQGYAKCSVSIISDKSIITADNGIAKAAQSKGLDVLLIEPDKKIALPGLDYGFIGGASGLLAKDLWAVSGDFNSLSSHDKIKNFLNNSINILSLSKNKVIDIGSILPICI